MRTPRSILAFGVATMLAAALAVGCVPGPSEPTTTTSTTSTTTSSSLPVAGACHQALPGNTSPVDFFYTGTPNVAHNLWYTESTDGSCTGPVHFDWNFGTVVRFEIVGLASDVPVGAFAGETAYTACLAMGGNYLDSHPLDQSLAGFTAQDYLCLLRLV